MIENSYRFLKEAANRSLAKELWTGSIPEEEKKRLCNPLLPKGFQLQPPSRPRCGRQRQETLRCFDPIQPQRVCGPANYQNEILDLYKATTHDGEVKGCHYIRWRFIQGLEKDLISCFMENVEENIRTSFWVGKPSVSQDLLNKALIFPSAYDDITKDEGIIKNSILIHKQQTCQQKAT